MIDLNGPGSSYIKAIMRNKPAWLNAEVSGFKWNQVGAHVVTLSVSTIDGMKRDFSMGCGGLLQTDKFYDAWWKLVVSRQELEGWRVRPGWVSDLTENLLPE